MIGAVERCHNAWASMILAHGGKSKSSRAVAAVVSSTNTAALLAKPGRYVFGFDRNLHKIGRDDGREYRIHKALCVRPRVKLNAML